MFLVCFGRDRMKIVIDIKKNLSKQMLIRLLQKEDISKNIIDLLNKFQDFQGYMNWRGDRVYSITIKK